MSEQMQDASHWWGRGTSTDYSYWTIFPSLSILEAAYIYDGHDPRAISDLAGPDGFPIDLSDEIKLIASACQAEQIRCFLRTAQESITKETMIDRVSFAHWLLQFKAKKDIGEKLLSSSSSMGTPDSKSDQITTPDSTTVPPPGKIPRTAASRLAICAAWEIECYRRKPATNNETFQRLIDWSKGMKHTETLRPYDPEKRGIPWVTSNTTLKYFSREACKRALTRWRRSRQNPSD